MPCSLAVRCSVSYTPRVIRRVATTTRVRAASSSWERATCSQLGPCSLAWCAEAVLWMASVRVAATALLFSILLYIAQRVPPKSPMVLTATVTTRHVVRQVGSDNVSHCPGMVVAQTRAHEYIRRRPRSCPFAILSSPSTAISAVCPSDHKSK